MLDLNRIPSTISACLTRRSTPAAARHRGAAARNPRRDLADLARDTRQWTVTTLGDVADGIVSAICSSLAVHFVLLASFLALAGVAADHGMTGVTLTLSAAAVVLGFSLGQGGFER